MSLEPKIDQLIKDVTLLIGKVEQRAKVNEQGNAQAIQIINQAGHSVNGATRDIQRITSQTISSAIQKPVAELDLDLTRVSDNLVLVANNVEKHIQESVVKFKRVTTIAIGAVILAGVVVAGASTYAIMQSSQKIKQADWVSNINTAISIGKLAACPDGGICAVIDKKQIHLDK